MEWVQKGIWLPLFVGKFLNNEAEVSSPEYDELEPPPLDGPHDAGAPSTPSQQKSEVSATLLQEGAADFGEG